MCAKLTIFNLHYIIGICKILKDVGLHLLTEEDRRELRLTHLRGAGFEYLSERHVGSYAFES